MDAETRFRENTSLAYHIVHKYYHKTRTQDLEDVYQTALLGLWKACLAYDESKGIEFSTYAGRCVYNEVGMYLRPMKKRRGLEFVSYETCIDDGMSIESTIGEPDDEYSLTEMRMMIDTLDEQEKEIVELKVRGLSQGEISEYIGCTQPTISRRLRSIKNKLTG